MFYERFEELCRQKGVSPSGACLAIGMSKGTSSFWKRSGATPKREALVKIAEYFDVPLAYLLDDDTQDEYDTMSFWDKFHRLCMSHGTTTSAIRQQLGLSNSVTTNWKRGAIPKHSTLQRIADIFHVPISYFYDETKDPDIAEQSQKFWRGLCVCCYHGGTSPNEVAKQVGATDEDVEKWKNGTLPGYDEVKAIADHFGVSISDLYNCQFEDAAPQTTSQIQDIVTDNVHMIPVYESVSAGFGAYADNHIVDKIPLFIRSSYEADDTILIRVSGDSMSPVIEDGDLIQVHKQDSVDSGDIAVVLLDGEEGLVKKVVYDTEFIELISLNPKYRTRRFDGEEVLRLRVVGKVRRVIRDL